MQQQFEDERRGDLVRHVGHAHVEKGKLGLDGVADDDLQFVLKRRSENALLQLGHQSRVDFHCHHLFYVFQKFYLEGSKEMTEKARIKNAT